MGDHQRKSVAKHCNKKNTKKKNATKSLWIQAANMSCCQKTRIWQEEVATSFGCMGLNMFARNDSRMPGLKCAVHPECFSDKYIETQHLDSKRQYKLSAANLIPTSTLDKRAAGVMYPTTEAVRINMCNLASQKPQGKQEDFPHTLQSPQHGNGKRFVQILTHFPTAWWFCILGKCLGYPSVWPRHMQWIPPRCSGVEGLWFFNIHHGLGGSYCCFNMSSCWCWDARLKTCSSSEDLLSKVCFQDTYLQAINHLECYTSDRW